MLAEVLLIVDNAFSFKERSSNMDSNCAVEELSDTLQSCEPFSVTDNDTCKSLVAPDIPVTEVLAGAFNSISIVESSGQRDDEGKSNGEFYVPSKHKCPDSKCSSPPRRSAQNSKSNQKTKQRKSGKKLGKTTVKKPLLDTVLLTTARKTRSYVCKPTRTSLWGSLGYISQIFQQSTGLDVGQIEHTKSLKARASKGSGKRNKNHSRRSNGNSCSVSGRRIRLKVTLGKEVVQSCLTNMVSDIDNGFRNDWGNTIEDHGLTDGSEYKLKEEEPGSHGFHCCNLDQEKVVMLSDSHLDVCNANKNLEIPVIIEKLAGVNVDNHQRVPSQIEFEGSEVAGDNLYLDSGTSPDSEVINLIPEAQVNRNVQEDLHDVLIPSQARVAPDITSLDLPEMSSKKGKKMDKLPCAGSFIVEDRFSSPEVVNKATVLEKWGQGENTGDCFYSREASLSTAVTEDLCTRLDGGLESRELHISEKFRPYTKTKGQKHSKSSKSRGLRKSGSEVSDSPKSRRGNGFRQKGNPAKSVSRRKGDDKGAFDEVVRKVENQQETGDCSSDDPAKTKAGNEITTKDMFNLSMVPRVVGEQYLPPRNAWVCCDDCFKWRRIPACLADSIEETNCRWTCKDNMDEGFADCSIPQEKSNAEINAELEISDASCEEDARDVRLNSKRLDPKHLTVHQQSSWMLIKSNLFLHRSRKTQTIDEIMVCHCKPPPNGRMGCGDGCLNRMLNIECVQGTCPCGEICSNQQFQKHKYAKLTWFRCGKKGYGLQSLEAISKGQFLIEYVGEVLDMQAYEARQREYASMGHKHFYFMTLNGSEVIDACAKGNLGRFINHSCDPNCRTEKWMVNGEVCIGLFALRDIKKGEEVTFDYNYVRVFGAAVKKCVCGSSQCRGYIGGDPVNTEVIVQGDSDEEYPEPVMCYEDGEIDDNVKHLISSTTSVDGKEMQIADNILGNKHKMDISTIAVGHLESTAELQTTKILVKDKNETNKSVTSGQHSEITTGNSSNKSASGARLQISLEMDNPEVKLSPSVLQEETSSQLDDVSSKTIFNVQQEFVQRLETSALKVMSSKSLSDTIDTKKCKSDTIEGRHTSKSRPLMKTSRSSSSVKKGKSNSNPVNVHKSEMIANKSHVLPYKPKKIMEGSLSGRFEAVEEKLNDLLDADGGVSKRKDATKGYLKLLLLTATSGDSGNGEAIQSNRDLSMILDGLLKTKSRVVLVDIINKNGLQMLHNIMKRYRRDFKKIPILRKLLKVLEYLAMREILTLEHITGGPRCPGMESFKESILNLTEHDDKQVHQIARNFRDRWIPKSARKSSSMDKSDGRVEFQRGLNCNTYSESQNHWCDYGVKTTEAIDCVKQSIVATNPVDTGTVESCSASCSSGCPTSGTKIRKRKSRWDQPAEIKTDVLLPPHKEPKIEPSLLQKSHSGSQAENGQVVLDHINWINTDDKQSTCCIHNLSLQMENRADDGGQNIDEDVPPGFSPFSAPSVPSSASSAVIDVHRDNGYPAKFPCEVVMGHPPRRFINRQAVSYGIPLPVVQQFGIPQAETLESWIVAPGMPFHPFPPLPSYPRDKREPPPCAGNTATKNEHAGCERGNYCSSVRQSDQHAPSTSGASLPNMETRGANNHRTFQRGGRGNNGLGRRYFKQQKWNNSELGPPWFRNRNSWGNNLRNEMCSSIGVASVANEIRGPISSANASTGVDGAYNTFHQYPQHQNWHY